MVRLALLALALGACANPIAPLPADTAGNVTVTLTTTTSLTAGGTADFAVRNQEAIDLVYKSCFARIERRDGDEWKEWRSNRPRCDDAGINARAGLTIPDRFKIPSDIPDGEYRLVCRFDGLTDFMTIVKRSSTFFVST